MRDGRGDTLVSLLQSFEWSSLHFEDESTWVESSLLDILFRLVGGIVLDASASIAPRVPAPVEAALLDSLSLLEAAELKFDIRGLYLRHMWSVGPERGVTIPVQVKRTWAAKELILLAA